MISDPWHSLMSCVIASLGYRQDLWLAIFKAFYLFIFRERGNEGEK